MISIESAETSKRGDSLSSSEVMAASGEAGDGVGDAPEDDVLAHRLWMEPCLQCRKDAWYIFDGRKQVKARRVIIELSCLGKIDSMQGVWMVALMDASQTLGPPASGIPPLHRIQTSHCSSHCLC